MDKRAAGLVGAVAGIAAIGSAQASTQPPEPPMAHQVISYADLLAPIPNAVALLKADDAARAQRNRDFRLAQGYYYDPYNGYAYPPPPPPVNYYSPYSYQPYYYYRHHHHHHHHHYHHHHQQQWD